MHAITLRSVPAPGSAHLVAAGLSSAARTGGSAAGVLIAAIAVVVVIAVLVVIGSALRGLATLLAEAVQLTARITSVLFTAVIVVAVATVILVHR